MIILILLAPIVWWVYAQIKSNLFNRIASTVLVLLTSGTYISIAFSSAIFYERGYTRESMRLLAEQLPSQQQEPYLTLAQDYKYKKISASELLVELQDLAENKAANDLSTESTSELGQ